MYLLFDIGGTHARFALSTDGTSFSDVVMHKTPKSYQDGIDLIQSVGEDLYKDTQYTAIIGGVAASFDRSGNRLTGGGPQIHDWLDKPIKEDMRKIFNAPVYIHNDAMMGALAQSHFGPAKGKKISVYITVSTGVGGARIIDGKIDKNAFGFEPGWQIIDAGNALCNGWSDRGYLIDYIGGMGIEKNKQMQPEKIDDESFWKSRAKFLAYGLHNIAVTWSPDIITVGGGVAGRIPFSDVEHFFNESIKDVFPNTQPQIARAAFGDEMGMWGAVGYIKTHLQ